jgi:integrase
MPRPDDESARPSQSARQPQQLILPFLSHDPGMKADQSTGSTAELSRIELEILPSLNPIGHDLGAPTDRGVSTPNPNGKDPRAPTSLRELAERVRDSYKEEYAYRERYQDRMDVPSSPRSVSRVFDMLIINLGKSWASELQDPALIREFQDCEAFTRLSPSTQRGRLATLKSIMNRSKERGWLSSVPTEAFPNLSVSRETPRGVRSLPPSPDDAHSLMNHLASADAWRDRRLHILVSLVLLAGTPDIVARRLSLADVDLASKTIWCRRRWRGPIESVKPKPIRIGDEVAAIIEPWIPFTGGEWLIPNHRRTGRWSTRHPIFGPLGCLEAACRTIGIEPITFEQLRRFHDEHAVPYLPFPGIANLSSITSSLPSPEMPATFPLPVLAGNEPIAEQTAASGAEVSPNGADPLDLIAIANALRQKGLTLEGAFIEHFHRRQQATHDEIVEAVCPGEERDWATIKTWVNRVKNALSDLGVAHRLSFRTTIRGYLVIRETPPSGLFPGNLTV